MLTLQGFRITTATQITLLRFIAIPFIAYAIMLHAWYNALLLFIFAVITDVVDGMVARWRNEQTALGASLDPIADKVLIITTLVMLWLHMPLRVAYLGWVITLLCIKEFLLLFGIAVFYFRTGTVTIQPVQAGKIAMVYQALLVFMLCMNAYMGFPGINFIGFFMYPTLGASITPLVMYGMIGWRSLKKSAT